MTMFDCLHDMGDPVGRRAPRPRHAQARRHLDDRRAERRRPGRGEPQPGRARLLRVLHAAVHAGIALAGGRARARRAGRRGEDRETSSRRAASPASAGPPRRRSTSCSKRARDHDWTARSGTCALQADAPDAARREQTRARYPDARATSSATACGSTTRSTATASRRSCCCRRGRSSTRAPGSADPLPRPPLPGGHVRRPRQRPLGPSRRQRAYDRREFAADALAVMDATETARAALVSLSCGAR